jgi:hypothetical protein
MRFSTFPSIEKHVGLTNEGRSGFPSRIEGALPLGRNDSYALE